MSEDRPALAAFDDETIEAVATDRDLSATELGTVVERHQETVRDLPGVEDIVYEWRSQFHEDPLVHRTEAVYVLAHRPHVWAEYGVALDLDDNSLDAVREVHARQARALVDEGAIDGPTETEPMVLTRP